MGERAPAGSAEQGRLVLERLRGAPGGRQLLELAARREDLALIGGAVRDLLLGRPPRELDVTVAGASRELAAELAKRLGGEGPSTETTTLHERFGTAVVEWVDGRIDIAERRTEAYARPGALPQVRPGTIAEDLARRDFTVNAMAVGLGGPQRGRLQAVEHALDDLAARRLRVLHARSFADDPTRLLRLCRYQTRLGFVVERETARLAHEALAGGALDTLSGARIAGELWLATEEPACAAFTALGELGVLQALSLPAPFDTRLLAEAASLMPPDGSRGLLEMAVLFHPAAPPGEGARAAAARIMERFEFLADVRERVLAGAFDSLALAAGIERARRPSQLRALLADRPVEAIAVAGALAARRAPETATRVRDWLGELRTVRLHIDGRDLLAAGIPEGPEIGRRLGRALDLRLDGELAPGREAELAAALDVDA